MNSPSASQSRSGAVYVAVLGGHEAFEGMGDAPLVRPGAWGGTHAMWIAGHITVVEGRLQKGRRKSCAVQRFHDLVAEAETRIVTERQAVPGTAAAIECRERLLRSVTVRCERRAEVIRDERNPTSGRPLGQCGVGSRRWFVGFAL